MERWEGKVAIVTGASAGIGAAISKDLVEKGVLVAGLARRIDKIEELAKSLADAPGKLFPIRCDVTKEEDILRCFKYVNEHIGPLHILINNAGLTRPTSIVDGVTEDWRKIFDVNVIACCICCREAIKYMNKENIEGHLVIMNSIAGHYVACLGEPSLNVYPSSKFAVTAFAESLRQELRYHKSNIKLTSISPGVVSTEFFKNMTGYQEGITALPHLDPEDVSNAVVFALSTPPHVQIQELIIRPLGEMF